MKKQGFNPALNVYEDMFLFEDKHFWYLGLRDLLEYWVKKLPVKKVLDAGCGTGRNMILFQELGCEVYGLDLSVEALNYSRSKNLANLKLGSLTSIPYSSNYVDLVTCIDVMGNLDSEELQETLKEFNRVLNSEGFLIINVSALPWMYSNHDRAWDIKQRYYLNDLASEVEKSDFKIIKASYRVSLLFPLIFIFRKIESVIDQNSDRGDTHVNNYLMNLIFSKIMLLENWLLKFINFPIGSSVFLVAQKINDRSF